MSRRWPYTSVLEVFLLVPVPPDGPVRALGDSLCPPTSASEDDECQNERKQHCKNGEKEEQAILGEHGRIPFGQVAQCYPKLFEKTRVQDSDCSKQAANYQAGDKNNKNNLTGEVGFFVVKLPYSFNGGKSCIQFQPECCIVGGLRCGFVKERFYLVFHFSR